MTRRAFGLPMEQIGRGVLCGCIGSQFLRQAFLWRVARTSGGTLARCFRPRSLHQQPIQQNGRRKDVFVLRSYLDVCSLGRYWVDTAIDGSQKFLVQVLVPVRCASWHHKLVESFQNYTGSIVLHRLQTLHKGVPIKHSRPQIGESMERRVQQLHALRGGLSRQGYSPASNAFVQEINPRVGVRSFGHRSFRSGNGIGDAHRSLEEQYFSNRVSTAVPGDRFPNVSTLKGLVIP